MEISKLQEKIDWLSAKLKSWKLPLPWKKKRLLAQQKFLLRKFSKHQALFL